MRKLRDDGRERCGTIVSGLLWKAKLQKEKTGVKREAQESAEATLQRDGTQSKEHGEHGGEKNRHQVGTGLSPASCRTCAAYNEKGVRARDAQRIDRLIRTGLLGLLGALLLDFLDLVDEVVSLLLQAGTLFGALHHVRLAAIEEVQVGHGIVVVRLDLDGFLQVGDAFVHEGAIL